MIKLHSSVIRAAVLATFVSGMTLAGSTFAAPIDTTAPVGPPNTVINLDSQGKMTSETQDTSSGKAPDQMTEPSATPAMTTHHDHAMHGPMSESPADMKKHVEMRIKSLHDKLMITKDQEAAWNDVANAMRDNESKTAALVSERQQNAGTMNAVDDMQSYQKIAQAHADGFAKVIAPFQTLYNSMSDAQKKNADKVFGSFEGHGGGKTMHHHHKAAK